MRNVIAYTAARLLLFAATYGLVYLLGARELLAIVIAFLVSGLVSFVLLSKRRDAMSAAITEAMDRKRGVGARFEEGAAKEDQVEEGAPGEAEPLAEESRTDAAER